MFMEPMEIEETEVKPNEQLSTSQPDPEPVTTPTPAINKDNHQMGQHFFPSFAPVFSLGHSRPHQLFHQVFLIIILHRDAFYLKYNNN